MRKSIVLAIAFLALNLSGKSQSFEPTILVLSPHKISADKKMKKEVDDFHSTSKKKILQNLNELEEYRESFLDEPENMRIILEKQIEFFKNYNSISAITESYLQYRFFERFENLLIYATSEQSDGKLASLGSLADKHKMQYLINFPNVHTYIRNGRKETSLTVQLYDHVHKKIVMERIYKGGDNNPGFEFSCTDYRQQAGYHFGIVSVPSDHQ
jgi:hypothetical protein